MIARKDCENEEIGATIVRLTAKTARLWREVRCGPALVAAALAAGAGPSADVMLASLPRWGA